MFEELMIGDNDSKLFLGHSGFSPVRTIIEEQVEIPAKCRDTKYCMTFVKNCPRYGKKWETFPKDADPKIT